MLAFIYGMTHCFLEDEHIILLEDVYQRLRKMESWINSIDHHMEDTLQETEQPRNVTPQKYLRIYIIIFLYIPGIN